VAWLHGFSQQSLSCVQRSPGAKHIGWHVGTCAVGLDTHIASSQQLLNEKSVREHGDDRGRHTPNPPEAQRCVSVLQDPEQQPIPPSPQKSPDARQLPGDVVQRSPLH
jgi:hypothetical protein